MCLIPCKVCLGFTLTESKWFLLLRTVYWLETNWSVSMSLLQPVGCDGQLYSSKTVDRCGVCGGNGTSCQRISGSYRKALTQLGNTHTNTDVDRCTYVLCVHKLFEFGYTHTIKLHVRFTFFVKGNICASFQQLSLQISLELTCLASSFRMFWHRSLSLV